MKKLLKYISPFAPDQSGASAVLFELGGLIVICDAGGCTGNVCGFDEPRWFHKKSAIFSAGLRDMDAILGRDEKLVEKLVDASNNLKANFIAIIGTPVPAVIATDYHALSHMIKRKTGLEVITVDTDGTKLYDVGEEKAYMELFRTFAKKDVEVKDKTVGVIGMTPLELSELDAGIKTQEILKAKGYENVYTYGMDCGLEEVRKAGEAKKNIVVSVSGIKAAKYLEKEFGTPYEVAYPLLDGKLEMDADRFRNKKILVVNQQVIGNEIRNRIEEICHADVRVATWFEQSKELKREGDLKFRHEEDFVKEIADNQYDIIIGDNLLKRAIKEYNGEFIDFPNFAISGRLW